MSIDCDTDNLIEEKRQEAHIERYGAMNSKEWFGGMEPIVSYIPCRCHLPSINSFSAFLEQMETWIHCENDSTIDAATTDKYNQQVEVLK